MIRYNTLHFFVLDIHAPPPRPGSPSINNQIRQTDIDKQEHFFIGRTISIFHQRLLRRQTGNSARAINQTKKRGQSEPQKKTNCETNAVATINNSCSSICRSFTDEMQRRFGSGSFLFVNRFDMSFFDSFSFFCSCFAMDTC